MKILKEWKELKKKLKDGDDYNKNNKKFKLIGENNLDNQKNSNLNESINDSNWWFELFALMIIDFGMLCLSYYFHKNICSSYSY